MARCFVHRIIKFKLLEKDTEKNKALKEKRKSGGVAYWKREKDSYDALSRRTADRE